MKNSEQKNYRAPSVQVLVFNKDDIVRTSGGVSINYRDIDWGTGNFDNPFENDSGNND